MEIDPKNKKSMEWLSYKRKLKDRAMNYGKRYPEKDPYDSFPIEFFGCIYLIPTKFKDEYNKKLKEIFNK